MITRAGAARPPARIEAKAEADARRAPGPKSRWASPWLWGFLSTGALALLILRSQAGSEASAGRLAFEFERNAAFILKSFWDIAPFFLLSVAVSAWVTVAGYAGRIRGVFVRRPGPAIAGAAAVGAVVPFCSCGVIPLIAALLASGVPLGPVMAFWLSSPLMSPEKFMLTAGVLGADYAVARLIAAVALGAAAGCVAHLIGRGGRLDDQIRVAVAPGAGEARGEGEAGGFTLGAFAAQMKGVGLYLFKWLAAAFFLEALIVHYVDPAWIGALLGSENSWSIPLASAVGIPLYTSGVAAIPITKGLLAAGMGPGAAMAFLVAGPGTCAPAMAGVWALVRSKIFAIYLGVAILGSLVAGYAFQFVTRL